MINDSNITEGSFRDRISTVDADGKRKWLFPKKPKGPFFNYRAIVSYVLLATLFIGPWIRINGEPLILINIITRKFVLFGQVFWPQDLHLFGLIMILFIVFVILFTTVFGRVFCGWMCPQTIFMEMVFRRIEYWIDGDFRQQERLKNQPWNMDKVIKRSLKYILFYLISLAISHTFLAYIIGSEELIKIQTEPLSEHKAGFISILIFSLVFFFVYSWFREQVCLIVCPYGRLQGVMLDRNSLVVAYDYIRGEGKSGRSKFRKNENRKELGKGDCIDCNKCVQVCPTGIDIRNGTQLECVNCMACVDECNFMMKKTGQEEGLIRLDSENNIAEGKGNKFTFRSKAYTVVLVLLIGVIAYLFTLRGVMEATILKVPGMQYQEEPGGYISNLYNVKVVNKSNHDLSLTFELMDMDGQVVMVGEPNLLVKKGNKNQRAFFVKLLKSNLYKKKTPVVIGIYQDGERIATSKTNFLGPK